MCDESMTTPKNSKTQINKSGFRHLSLRWFSNILKSLEIQAKAAHIGHFFNFSDNAGDVAPLSLIR